jgi:benzodiazapine receptor
MNNRPFTEFLKLAACIVICQLAGFVGSIFTTPAIPEWYATLNKPSFTPPNWLFAPVWLTLYTLMGIAAFLVWQKALTTPKVKTALGLFAFQLFLNALWSVLFFGLRSPLAGLLEILILWLVILLTILFFVKLSRVAALLLLPYIVWVSFAALLNFSIVILNP